MKYLLIVGAIFFSGNIYCQNKSLIGCDYLKKILSMDICEKQFKMSEFKGDSIRIVDTLGILNKCDFSINGVSYIVTQKIANGKDAKLLMVYNIEKVDGKYVLYLLKPLSNTAVAIKIWKQRNKIRTNIEFYGTF